MKKSSSQISVIKNQISSHNSPNNSCLVVNDNHSVTVTPPACDSSRLKSELYTGFSHVFSSHSSQDEVYDKMVRPIVEEFLKGRSGLLAAMGPTGSGKTHTVFGSAKDPGLIPRALRHIFDTNVGHESMSSRSFYLSVFEIYSEKGKGEKLCDLSHDGGDIYMQQSSVKGLKQVLVRDVAEAESVLAHAMSKRATAMTNSNSQSSRSQCIINIRCSIHDIEGKSESPLSGTVLTFIDLAGAEREKKTQNQGGRLLESNFINNTSMVFSLCLRSLLEHQKNPKKPLQRHFQSSLLTRYLRDYLEGRKRMALILTAKSGPEDYFDTCFLLRQASPYMEIRFHNLEETFNLPSKRRRNQVSCTEQQKRVKLCDADEKNEVGVASGDSGYHCKEDLKNECKTDNTLGVSENSLDAKLQREYNIVQRVAKALWSVLKQYKERVKAMQREIDVLTENVRTGHDQLEILEKELHIVKSRCSCPKQVALPASCFIGGANSTSRVGSLEDLAGHEQVASATVEGLVNVEPEVKPFLPPAGGQCSFYPANEPLGVIASEEKQEHSPTGWEAANLFQKTDELNHFGDETAETLKSEARCKWNGMETNEQKSEDSEKDYGFSVSQSIENGSEVDPDFGPTNETEAELANSSSVTKTFPQDEFRNSSSVSKTSAFVDEKIEANTSLIMPSQECTLPSLYSESSLQQNDLVHHLPMECVISHDDLCKNDSPEKMDAIDKDDKELIDVATCFPQHLVTEQKVQQANHSNNTNEEDKENVTNAPESNSFELVTAKKSHRKTSKSERPKRRLMPASSLLLRDVGSMDIADESTQHRRSKGGQKSVAQEVNTTRGNASLLRILKSHLPR